jgi:NAD(P)-dependent dehydrogenase (short-subunit alcohol dehydrogenase family)
MEHKTALITGTSRGLGAVVAHFLAAQGWRVIGTARATPADPGIEVLAGDVCDAAHRRRLVAAAGPRLDLLVNNASDLGPSPLPPLGAYPLDALEAVLRVNVVAPVALVQEALPALRAAGGLVVNISSDAALGGYEGWGAYGASKAALDLISLTMANELRPEGVSVVSVDPGDMRTQMHRDAFPGEDISDRPLPDVTLPFWAWLLAQPPLSISGRRYLAQADHWESAA